ncbi:terpene synthase family protein [Aspergillus affinis]|uniref:terpene synthase family protein n=1 Tax=Aspergillus affinis TaxID=1070780 RepID=UPI0022FDCA4E|nr:terpenoid synthase [Aspergillus affinis]KAI9036497.1 terpenoid synthase [Aspergillus affinis]
MTAFEDHRAPMLRALKGQTLEIPDLAALIYPDWHVDQHEMEPEVRRDIDNDFVGRWFPENYRRQKFAKGSFAEVAGYFCNGCQLFVWDDGKVSKIDCGNLTKDETGTKQCQNDTISFLKTCLEPNEPGSSQSHATLGTHNSNCFKEIGDAMKKGQSKEALHRFAVSMYEYVDSVCHAQKVRVTGFPTWEEYLDNREQTVGAYPYIMAMEYAYEVVIPSWVYETEEFQVMFKETTIAIIMVNDICSLKKEITEEQVESAIPLKMHHQGHKNAQDALNEIIEDMSKSRQRFNVAEHLFLQRKEYQYMNASAQGGVEILIQGCKNMILGNLKWSFSTKRYEPDERPGGWAATYRL